MVPSVGAEFLDSVNQFFLEAHTKGFTSKKGLAMMKSGIIQLLNDCGRMSRNRARANNSIKFPDGEEPRIRIDLPPSGFKIDNKARNRLQSASSSNRFVNALQSLIRAQLETRAQRRARVAAEKAEKERLQQRKETALNAAAARIAAEQAEQDEHVSDTDGEAVPDDHQENTTASALAGEAASDNNGVKNLQAMSVNDNVKADAAEVSSIDPTASPARAAGDETIVESVETSDMMDLDAKKPEPAMYSAVITEDPSSYAAFLKEEPTEAYNSPPPSSPSMDLMSPNAYQSAPGHIVMDEAGLPLFFYDVHAPTCRARTYSARTSSPFALPQSRRHASAPNQTQHSRSAVDIYRARAPLDLSYPLVTEGIKVEPPSASLDFTRPGAMNGWSGFRRYEADSDSESESESESESSSDDSSPEPDILGFGSRWTHADRDVVKAAAPLRRIILRTSGRQQQSGQSESPVQPEHPKYEKPQPSLADIILEMHGMTATEWNSNKPRLLESLSTINNEWTAPKGTMVETPLQRFDSSVNFIPELINRFPTWTWAGYMMKLSPLFASPTAINWDFQQRLYRIGRVVYRDEEKIAIANHDWVRLEAAARTCVMLALGTGPSDEADSSEEQKEWLEGKMSIIRWYKRYFSSPVIKLESE